jgi:hypothetical protein
MFGVLQAEATPHHFLTKNSAIEGLVPEDRKCFGGPSLLVARQTLAALWDKPMRRGERCLAAFARVLAKKSR